MLKSSSHQPAAQAFVAFLVSKEGQAVIAHSHSYEYPLRPGVSASLQIRPFDQLQLQRLKKRKLLLKDQISKIESELLPDIIA